VQLPFFLPDVSFTTLRRVLTPYVRALGDAEAFWELIQLGLGTNPRRVKRYINVLNLTTAVLDRMHGGGVHTQQRLQLAKLLILRSEHRSFFHTLTQHPEAWQQLDLAARKLMEAGVDRAGVFAELPTYLHPFRDNAALMRLMEIRPDRYHGHPPAPGGRGGGPDDQYGADDHRSPHSHGGLSPGGASFTGMSPMIRPRFAVGLDLGDGESAIAWEECDGSMRLSLLVDQSSFGAVSSRVSPASSRSWRSVLASWRCGSVPLIRTPPPSSESIMILGRSMWEFTSASPNAGRPLSPVIG
jgi:hypothetical protein